VTAKIPADSTSRLGRWPSGMPALSRDISRPLHGVRASFMMSAEAVRFLFAGPFKRESSWSRPGPSCGSQWCRHCWWPSRSRFWSASPSIGNAVNETVVIAFMSLFVVNVVVTAIGVQLTAN